MSDSESSKNGWWPLAGRPCPQLCSGIAGRRLGTGAPGEWGHRLTQAHVSPREVNFDTEDAWVLSIQLSFDNCIHLFACMQITQLRYRTLSSCPSISCGSPSRPTAPPLSAGSLCSDLSHWPWTSYPLNYEKGFFWSGFVHPDVRFMSETASRCMPWALKCHLLYFPQRVPCMNVPQFIFPLFCWKLFGVFPVWGYYGSGCREHSSTSLFVDLCFHCSWVRT